MVKRPPELKKRALSVKQLLQSKQHLGSVGERLAVAYLRTQQYRVLATNLRVGLTEVDIIALDTKFQEIAFIEVKTRSSHNFGHPSNAVNYKKIANMRQVARQFLKKYPLQQAYRFDIIAITGTDIEHIENITWP